MDKLLTEIEKQRQNIKTDQYSMSIGEIINLYKEGDIKLDPAFQRLFRWTDEQKTKFIESVLLGIPIPEVFVSQQNDGKWTVIDGVQRISTILQLIGDLKSKDPLKMTTTKYLPSLEGVSWKDLPDEAQRIFKRAKFGINIILTENSVEAQYELFQRLNTGGLHLEDQEIRNCLIIMMDADFYEKINKLKDHPSFKNTIQLSDKKYEEEYHMELILRYFIAVAGLTDYKKYPLSSIHLSEFIDKETMILIEDPRFDLEKSITQFKQVFDWINENLGEKAFRKYNSEKNDFEGNFSNASFEIITTGVSVYFDKIKNIDKNKFVNLINAIYDTEVFTENTKHGVRSPIRFKNLLEFAKEYFSNEI